MGASLCVVWSLLLLYSYVARKESLSVPLFVSFQWVSESKSCVGRFCSMWCLMSSASFVESHLYMRSVFGRSSDIVSS